MSETSEYISCRTCGIFTDYSEAINQKYCSLSCSKKYLRCHTCGKYFERTDEKKQYYCSPECAKKYILKENKTRKSMKIEEVTP